MHSFSLFSVPSDNCCGLILSICRFNPELCTLFSETLCVCMIIVFLPVLLCCSPHPSLDQQFSSFRFTIAVFIAVCVCVRARALSPDLVAEEDEARVVPSTIEEHEHLLATPVQQPRSTAHDRASSAAASQQDAVAAGSASAHGSASAQSYCRCRNAETAEPEGAPAPIIAVYWDESGDLPRESAVSPPFSSVQQNGSGNDEANGAAAAAATAVSDSSEGFGRRRVADAGPSSGSASYAGAGAASSDNSHDYSRAAAPELSDDGDAGEAAAAGGSDGRLSADGGLSRDEPPPAAAARLLAHGAASRSTSSDERSDGDDDEDQVEGREFLAERFDSGGGSSAGYRTAEATTHKLFAVPEGPARPPVYNGAEESV